MLNVSDSQTNVRYKQSQNTSTDTRYLDEKGLFTEIPCYSSKS